MPCRNGFLALGLVCFAVVGCNDDTDPSSGGAAAGGAAAGGGATGAGDTGGAAAEPRTIELALRNRTYADDNDVMVLVNHVDGTLVESHLGGELPIDVTVVDGDLVSYAYVSHAAEYTEIINSYRVAPGVQRIEAAVATLPTFPTCNAGTMQLTVHVPAVPGGISAAVQSSDGRFAQAMSLPADLTVEVTPCSPINTYAALVTVRGAVGFEAFELFQDLPFQDGGTLELTPTFATEPRAPLTFEVDQLDGATEAWGDAAWYGDYSYEDPDPQFLFTPNERDLDQTFTGDASFTYAPAPMDLPHGFQIGRLLIDFPADASSCRRGAALVRRGATSEVIPFHVTELAEPLGDMTSWSLGDGAIGDVATRSARNDTTSWTLHEDPTQSFPLVVFPVFPETPPPGFLGAPTVPTEIVGFSHDDTDAAASYAELVAQSATPKSQTQRSRSRGLTCP